MQKNLLVFNLKTDADDDILGFTTHWLNAFAREFDRVFVITMIKGRDETAPNVEVHSVGKEKGYSIFRRVIEFYRILFKILLTHRICGVFAHMIHDFTILAGPVMRLLDIPIIQWYAHKHVPLRLVLATQFVLQVMTSSETSCRLKNRKKILVVGQGVSIEKFSSVTRTTSSHLRFLSVSRISPIKRIDKMIDFVGNLYKDNNNVRFTIVGRPKNRTDTAYAAAMRKKVADLHLETVIDFRGHVPYRKVETVYAEADYFLNFSETGSRDKTVIEAIAAGCIPITTNEGFKEYGFYFPRVEQINLDHIHFDKDEVLKNNDLINVVRAVRTFM